MSAARVTLRPAAEQDLVDHADWLRGEAGPDTGERFLQAADQTFAALVDTPGLGAPTGSRWPELALTRTWQVAGFPDQLVFYMPYAEGILIVCVLHAARNWKR